MNPKVSIILVHLNQEDFTRECIRSLQQLTYPNAEIVLIDNGSTDGSGIRLQKQFPGVCFLRLEENKGFAGGNNVGMRLALERNAEFVVLLNNDTVVDPHFLEPLVALATSDTSVGVQSCKIYFQDPHDTFWYAGGNLDLQRAIGSHRGLHEKDLGQYDKVEETGFATGCMMFMSRKALNEIGMLDDDLFIYFEDADWCVRAREKGYKIIYNPKASIWHKVSALMGHDSPFYLYFLMRNKILFLRKHATVGQWLVRLPYFVYFYGRHIIRMSLKWHSKSGTYAVLLGLADGIRNVRGKGNLDRVRRQSNQPARI